MSDSIQALIIEDDFRIADINRRYVEKVEGYMVQEVVKTGEEALAYLENCSSLPQLSQLKWPVSLSNAISEPQLGHL